MKHLVAMVFIYLLVATVYAQLVPIEIVNNAEDLNGKALVTMFRDLIRRSEAYELTYAKNEAHFVVHINTMDRYKGDSASEGISTIYNYMILLNTGDGTQIYCYNQLGYVGKDVLSDVAYQIYTDLDEFVESFKSYMSNYSGE
ncbi:MAG TPA: hypothetical protein PL124_07065 [Candidatus Cloacimonadota bacterium]|nr:hypothetical protein [Candidatus Cloacimonadota bacterium]HPS39157.1 hypothetical protein [Candidatus Cloacimonadota bacterium]